MADLYVAVAAPGHLLHHCLVLSLIGHPVKCDCTCLPQEPATARLCHSIGDFMHHQGAHSPHLIVNTEMVARLKQTISWNKIYIVSLTAGYVSC